MTLNSKKRVMNLKTGKIFDMTEFSINHLKKTGQWKDMEIMPDLPPQVKNVTPMPPADKPARGRKPKAEETEETQTQNPETNETF